MKLIDVDKLKENIEYALLQHKDSEKWLEWINQVIDAEPIVMEQTDNVAIFMSDV